MIDDGDVADSMLFGDLGHRTLVRLSQDLRIFTIRSSEKRVFFMAPSLPAAGAHFPKFQLVRKLPSRSTPERLLSMSHTKAIASTTHRWKASGEVSRLSWCTIGTSQLVRRQSFRWAITDQRPAV